MRARRRLAAASVRARADQADDALIALSQACYNVGTKGCFPSSRRSWRRPLSRARLTPSLTAADTKDEFMTRRILAALNRALFAEPRHSEEVHFHQGSQGQPAPCYDPHCSSPHLDVR